MRDELKDKAWLDKWIAFSGHEIRTRLQGWADPTGDTLYRPQYIFDLAKAYLHLLLRRYSRGDPITELAQYFEPLLDAWEEAERLGQSVWTPAQQISRHAWKVNLDHYIDCFWLVGLALTLELEDAQWQRLLALIGNEGEDALLDRVIASRQPGRRIGQALCHPKPYQRLLDAALAPPVQQPALLRAFVSHWYAELDRLPKPGLSRDTAIYERPYWYDHHLKDGWYFGYWCLEAVAAVKAFGMDDSACLGLPHYPGDLLRPQGPSTHTVPTAQTQAQALAAVQRPHEEGRGWGQKIKRWALGSKA
jgi:hypothetical protein